MYAVVSAVSDWALNRNTLYFLLISTILCFAQYTEHTGTCLVSWLLHDPRGCTFVHSTILLDPVTFLLCDPTVATSFIYKNPTNTLEFMMHFFVSRYGVVFFCVWYDIWLNCLSLCSCVRELHYLYMTYSLCLCNAHSFRILYKIEHLLYFLHAESCSLPMVCLATFPGPTIFCLWRISPTLVHAAGTYYACF